ncbi:MAG: hypothetical protein ACOZCO_01765 [Bacteroidota bacterium]
MIKPIKIETNKTIPEIISFLEKNTYYQSKNDDTLKYNSDILQGLRENDHFLLRRIDINDEFVPVSSAPYFKISFETKGNTTIIKCKAQPVIKTYLVVGFFLLVIGLFLSWIIQAEPEYRLSKILVLGSTIIIIIFFFLRSLFVPYKKDLKLVKKLLTQLK